MTLSPLTPCRQAAARPGLLRSLLVLVLLQMAALPVALLHADDTVRRVQEELRKRNLYYGDIDGLRSRAVASALRRYQERKGFPATGEADAMTLRSLSLEPSQAESGENGDPPASATLTSNSNRGDEGSSSWPVGTVLKSDRASRHGVSGSDLFSILVPSVKAADASAATPPAAPTALPADPSLPPDSARPPHPPVEKPLTLDGARQVIEGYLHAGEASWIDKEMAFYADQVNYFNQGTVSRAWIRRDVQRYYRRWPRRHFELLEPLVMAPGPHENESTVRFAMRFRYDAPGAQGKSVHVEGKTENIFILQGTEPGAVRIVAVRERRLRG